ncbi:MAG: efflux RND transporter periplasmic adaptor subunit [Phycisphaerae bacterium]|jgi:Cu(I)/Ag(I) efflux system membrane fusion protein
MKRKTIIILIIVFLAGFLSKGFISSSKKTETSVSQQTGQAKEQWWTCSMHPQIHQPNPGKCPLCGMNLVPVNQENPGAAKREISFSNEALKLMDIQTTPVERKFVETQIRMFGKVDYDESKIKYITAWVPGRIDRLYVDFTGIVVSKGDHMVYLYSPQLISAQAELLQAAQSQKKLKPDSSEMMVRSANETLNATREKLRLLGLTSEQIQEVEKTGRPTDHVTITSPIGGIVIEKNANQGMYIDTGTKIYTIADLSEVWVKLDAYESDLVWLRYGQEVEFTTEAYPGEIFKGVISFISPVLDPQTRTIKLRVNVQNPDGKLKPEMFVRAVVRSKVAMGGNIMDPNMVGKWICPMHPSVVKETSGQCDICGMNLVKTETLGYVSAQNPEFAPLVIPATAPLITGKRAVVYVRSPDPNKPSFEGREVVLGPRAGDYYIVKEGLSQGESVVTNGNFKIDADLQIQAKPSMMSPEGMEKPMPAGHQH